MPSPKTRRKGGRGKDKKGRLSERTLSLHGQGSEVEGDRIPRPRTVPDLLTGNRTGAMSAADLARPPKLTKLLINVTVQRSLGALQVLMPPEATVEDLIAAVLRQYTKEARRPVLPSADPSGFDLHYSQFSLESLDRKKKLMELGSRNYFLWPKRAAESEAECGGSDVSTSTSSCSKEADNAIEKVIPRIKFMNFLL